MLTKPLGTGILTTALKRDALLETGLTEAVRSMTTLNDGAARAALAVGVSAATDVTGFGLLGHLAHMLAASQVGAEIAFEAFPVLDHARNLAGRGVVPGGTTRNLAAAEGVEWADDLSQTDRILCVDAQTSGGLLLAVPPENEAALLAGLRAEETPAAATIGRLTPGPRGPDPRRPVAVAFAPMSPLRWTAQRMDQLEHAARNGRRVALMRRGTEYHRRRPARHVGRPPRGAGGTACR